MDNMNNKYLEKIALTRLVKEIAKGGVSLTKEMRNKLVGSGAMRSGKTYVNGMDEGTKNIAARHNIPFHHMGDDHPLSYQVRQMGGAATIPEFIGGKLQPTVHIHKDINKHLAPLEVRTIHRHELNEAKGFNRDIKNGLSRAEDAKMVSIQSTFPHNGVTPFGLHNNLGILAHESNDIFKLPHFHVKNRNNQVLREFRNDSGEASTLAGITGKAYGKDRFTGKDIKN